MERKGHPRIEIKSADDFNCICQDMLDDFSNELWEMEGMKELIPDDDRLSHDIPNEATHYWSIKAIRIIERYEKRLFNIGVKYFDEMDLEISCLNVREF